jgi:hypothetical protein
MAMANPVHPGTIIREDVLAELGLSVGVAASRLGISRVKDAAAPAPAQTPAVRCIAPGGATRLREVRLPHRRSEPSPEAVDL